MVFEGAPRGIRLRSHGPLGAGEGLVSDVIVKMFIFTRFYKGKCYDRDHSIFALFSTVSEHACKKLMT